MKTNFEYDYDRAIALCCEYSEDPKMLKSLIEGDKLNIGANRHGVIPSPWSDSGRKMNCLLYYVTVNSYTFPFHGSHNDAEAFSEFDGDFRAMPGKVRRRREVNNSALYSILCCIKSELQCYECEPEDLGYSSDSIKDMAKWNEGKKHSRKLRSALGLSYEEIESLPS